jgi:Protein of unknown function (DUF3828)
MIRRWVAAGAALSLLVAAPPTLAKKPVGADEAAVRHIINRVYEGYSRPFEELFPELPDDAPPRPDNSPGLAIDGYETPYSASLASLVEKWLPFARGDEVGAMNDFDWYCQCQDFDPKTAKITAQNYRSKSKNKMEVKVSFTAGWDEGSPLTFYFIRENGMWVMDDLRFDGGSTLRKGLRSDIDDSGVAEPK